VILLLVHCFILENSETNCHKNSLVLKKTFNTHTLDIAYKVGNFTEQQLFLYTALINWLLYLKHSVQYRLNLQIQSVPLATEPSISLIILILSGRKW